MFDLTADPAGIAGALRSDVLLRPLVRAHPGLRLAGAWDVFECAAYILLEQHAGAVAARVLAQRLIERCGAPVASGADGLTHLFPSAATLASAPLEDIGLAVDGVDALRALAVAADAGTWRWDAGIDSTAPSLPGLSRSAAQCIALRALGDPDALPAADPVLQRMAAGGGAALTAPALTARAESWRPWRAYAATHLWQAWEDAECWNTDVMQARRA